MVTDVNIKESPEFIKKRLIAAGMRPINNVVDISNYVMLEYGQPLHFFDKEKLGNYILVRNAKENEKIITLDSKERILNSNDIVITDREKSVCIAGVMGGENTEVDNTTTDILIEAAIFDSVSIRNTANKLDLRSEASIRYGKGLNYEYTDLALMRACHLLEKYASAEILKDTVKYDKIDKIDKKVIFMPEDVNKLLGIKISEEDMKVELERLDFPYELKDGKFIVTIPKRRLDIDPYVNDIAEEIGRLYGYHNLVSTLPKVQIKQGEYKGDIKLRKDISKRLRNLGLNETKTYTLISPDMAKLFDYENKDKVLLPNPMSIDKSIVRTSILPSLINVYEYNKARKVNDINLYEIAKTYDKEFNEETKIAILMKGNYLINKWQNIDIKVDFYLIKGIIENLLDYLGFKNRYIFEEANIDNMHPGVCAKILLDREEIGIIGKIHPTLKKDDIFLSEISLTKIYNKTVKSLKYKEASRYPEINKDLAFIVDKNTKSSDIEKIIKKAGGRLLDNIDVFDLYTGEKLQDNEKSIAYSLTFKDSTRTLSEEEVMEIFNKIIIEVEKNGFKLRDK
jgi:phenylalanyl-tRNA synthetase beta chain